MSMTFYLTGQPWERCAELSKMLRRLNEAMAPIAELSRSLEPVAEMMRRTEEAMAPIAELSRSLEPVAEMMRRTEEAMAPIAELSRSLEHMNEMVRQVSKYKIRRVSFSLDSLESGR